MTIPGAEVTLLDSAGDPTGSARGRPQSLSVTVPPGIDASDPVLAARNVTASETWSPPSQDKPLKPGDAVKRTIVRKATGVPALGMLEFAFTAPEGVRVYADPPQVDDKVSRGEVTGSRIDQVTYVFEKPGLYELPPLDQPWWDLAQMQARDVPLPGLTVNVAAPIIGAAPEPSQSAMVTAVVLAAIMLAALLILLISNHGLRRSGRDPQSPARRTLIHTANKGDAAATYHALANWLACLPQEGREAMEQDECFSSLRGKLERALFGNEGAWLSQSGRDLAQAVEHAPLQKLMEVAPPALPPLNPAA
jgi:hypothetical protein